MIGRPSFSTFRLNGKELKCDNRHSLNASQHLVSTPDPEFPGTPIRLATDWPALEKTMHVNPVSAIHPLHIRQKPIVAPQSETDGQAAAGSPFDSNLTIPAHSAAYGSHRQGYHGDRAEYATQLLAESGHVSETRLEQRAQFEKYASSAEQRSGPQSHTVSLVA